MKVRLKPPATAYRRHVFNAAGNHVQTLRLRPKETLVIGEDDEDAIRAVEKDLIGPTATLERIEPEPEPEE